MAVAGNRMEEMDALSTTSLGVSDSDLCGECVKPSGTPPFQFAAAKTRTTTAGEDNGVGGESKLLGKGFAATSLLHIAIRNGIYLNQVANATGSSAHINMITGKSPNIYNLVSDSTNSSVNSLLARRRRHKRNLSVGSSKVSSAGVANPTHSASPLNTLSLDRKTLLRQKHQLYSSDKAWMRADHQRGCIHVHDSLNPSHPRPVLCTLDTTAEEMVCRLGQIAGGKSGTVLRMTHKASACVDLNGNRDEMFVDNQQCVPEGNSVKSLLPVSDLYPLEDNRSVRSNDILPTNNNHNQYYQDSNRISDSLLYDDKIPSNSSSEACLNDNEVADLGLSGVDSYGLYSGSDMESSTYDDLSPGGPKSSEQPDSLSHGLPLTADALAPSPDFDGATREPDPFESSSDEVDLDGAATRTPAFTQRLDIAFTACPGGTGMEETPDDDGTASAGDAPCPTAAPGDRGASPLSAKPLLGMAAAHGDPGELGGWPDPLTEAPSPGLYVQLHGGAVRRLEDDERPLQIQNDYLSNLGFEDPWRVLEEGMNPELGCLIRFYAGKPRSAGSSERVQLSGVFNVRKGKLALPVSRWSRRQVTLSGTCLFVSSVKHAHTGKMHILPLVGGKVEEVRRHSHCLAFSSAGAQSQTYYVSYGSYTEHLRWHRHAAKMASQRVSSVDLSCCSLEELPSKLFYSHDLTHLNLKHNFLSPHRGLAHLTRFCKLRSLNLSNNRLREFPAALCDITSLTELNLSGNRLSCLPSALGVMHNLQTLLLDGNALSSLPAALGSLEALTYLGLSFNRLARVPPALENLRGVERLCLAGNRLSVLDMSGLQWLPARHIDLRLNGLRSVVAGEAALLSHVAQLDLRDAGLRELDVRSLTGLEVLRCDRNALGRLRVAGRALKSLHAAHNELTQLEVDPIPENLTHLDASRNKLASVPAWVCDSGKLEVLDVSRNAISELPAGLLSGGSLRKVLLGWNGLRRLPERVERSHLEVLDVQHNQLTELPHNLFIKAQSLRYLNASANKLESIPPASQSEESFSSLQELYLTNNGLTDKSVPLLSGHAHLRVLHLAYNQLLVFPASKMARLEQLEELDLSGNRLRSVPTTILSCARMHTLAAHSNCISTFPEALQLAHIKCVDLSCNELTEVSLPETLPPKLQELDLTGNPRLSLDHKSLELLNNIRCFRVDPSPSSLGASEGPGAPAVWSHGYTEASGVKNKLCVAALTLEGFGGGREAAYGVFDGDRNGEVPGLLQCTMGDVLAEELHRSRGEEDYLTNTFLTMHRKLGTAGQRLGGSAALCHIRHDPVTPAGPGPAPPGHAGCFTLAAANVGKCQAVLCRDGRALPLSSAHTVRQEDEYRRIRQHNAIVTEDNKVNGVTDSTRIMGYSFLCPAVTPRPHVSTVTLTPQDEFFLLGSRGLWDALSPGEAVEAVRNVPDALAAAKKLVTLAQSYGCADSLGAVVVQLSVTQDCCSYCEPPPPPPSPGPAPHGGPHGPSHPSYPPSDGLLPHPPAVAAGSSSGLGSELSSEVSASEMSSEVGSTASSDEPAAHGEHAHPGPAGTRGGAAPPGGGGGGGGAPFQRQFSGALSDNGLDSEDEEPIAGVFSNGSRVEVEADVHCRRARDPPDPTPSDPASPPRAPSAAAAPPGRSPTLSPARLPPGRRPPASPAPPPPRRDPALVEPRPPGGEAWPGAAGSAAKTSTLGRKGRANGSVACQGRSQDRIEEAADAPVRKQGGYFNAPAQPDPDDQLVIPPELEDEVRQIMKQQQQQQEAKEHAQPLQQQADCFVTPL
ncbi:LOW QUALITY PROTEIN: PH domain leucine-rich repeat-containing protein phosphatase 1-like [Hypomesus transpacificus]|uniref:LOW QUALITY PROTEIN: PH domain leucine-rich repeat-containing protein phosphatase 1-like n=1 Tax=Hypomesus transpacificus TaxID=137520 RepID=UPI001F0785E6|nr:LOW QUALITY PROTEIN: PH domain leucine-rich repeat-containing protein phosphatase 1-like [Hypomesus transpacificus]